MANTYKNIVITPNTGSTTGDPTIVFSGGDSNTNTDIILRVYPTSNGTLSFEGNAGQLFSITNDLSNTIFSVNDVSGIPLLEINVASQQITLGQFYGNVGIGTGASNVNNYKLDVIGGANISLPNLTVGGTNVSAAIAAANANAATLSANVNVLAAAVVSNSQSLSANVNVLAAAVVANDASQGANIAVLAASFVSNSQSLSANVNTLAAALVLANTSAHADIDALSVVANAKVSSVTGTSGRITSSGGTAPAIDLATAGAGAATYSSGISAVTVDAYGRVTSVTGSAGYLTTTDFNTANANSVSQSANVNVLAANVNTLAGAAYPKTGGTISGDATITGNLTVSGTTTYVNTQTLLIGDNLVTLNADLPGNVQPTENSGLEVNRGARNSNAAFIWNETGNSWQFTSNTLAGVYSIVASQTDANNVGAAANNFAAATYLTQSTFNSANANSVSQSANVNVLAAAFVSNSQSLSANVNTLAATFVSANANTVSLSANVNVLAAAFVSNSQTLSANVNTLAATFASANANNVSLSANVNVLAAALSGYATTGQLANYLPLAGGTMTGLIIGRTSAGANTSVSNDGGALSVRGDATNAATISFHRPSAYAINMGLDTDNIFRIGGWSDGVNTYRVQLGTPGGTHTFTGTVAATTFSGAGTSLTGTAASLTAGNATTAGGFIPSQTNGVGNRIVVADASGYINNNYFNSTDDISSGTISYIMAKFGDNYYRSATAAKVASFLASQSFASPTFTGTGSVTGGFNVTPGNLGTISTGTTTLAASSGNYQYYTNGGAHTIAAPSSDCAIDILVTNSATAGAITLSGFTAPTGGGGDTYATTNANRYILSVRRINAISTYVWKALQ